MDEIAIKKNWYQPFTFNEIIYTNRNRL